MPNDSEEITLYEIPSPSERRRIHADIVRKKEQITEDQYHVFIQMGLSGLRTELMGLKGYLTMMLEGDFGKLATKHTKIVENLNKAATGMIDDTSNLLALGKLNKKQEALQDGPKDNKRYKILHFEDDSLLRGMYQTKFQMVGFDFAGYESPTKDPVSIVVKEKPDLILMDGIMPLLDGLEATILLKADARTRSIPILGLDNIGGDFADKAKKVGMVDYLVKANFMPSDIVNRVRQLLGLPIPPEKPIPPAGEAWHGQSVQEMIEKAPKQPSWWQRLFGK